MVFSVCNFLIFGMSNLMVVLLLPVEYNGGSVFMVILSLGFCFCLSFLTINQAPVLAISLFVLWIAYTILVMVVFGLGIDRKTSKLKRLQESTLSGLRIQSLENNWWGKKKKKIWPTLELYATNYFTIFLQTHLGQLLTSHFHSPHESFVKKSVTLACSFLFLFLQ